jgi:Domain of unknown function (DUF4214)/Bacterial Ig-like domain
MADDYAGDAGTAGILPINGSVKGHIDSPADEDWFRLDLKAGAAYAFNATSADGSEPEIYVYGPGGVPYIMYTNAPGHVNTFALTTPYSWVDDDQFYLYVKNSYAVDYTVGVRRLADDHLNDVRAAIPLAAGNSVGAQIDYSGDEEYFRIAAVKGSTYKVKLTADGGTLPSGAALKITGAYGWADITYSTENGASVMTLKADETKDYYFLVDTDPNEAVAAPLKYHVAMTGGSVAVPPVVPPVVVPAPPAVDTGRKLNAVEGTVDGALKLTFDGTIKPGTGSIELRDANGALYAKWQMADSNVTVSGSTVTIDPLHNVLAGNYTVNLGGITDPAGNALNASAAQRFFTIDRTADGGHAVTGQDWLTAWGENDTAVFTGRPEDYKISYLAKDFYEIAGGTGKTTLGNIERVMFTQGDDVVALSQNGQLGQAWRLYQAAFDRAPDKGGLGYWLFQQQKGLSLDDVAQNFLTSKEFVERYGVQTNAEFVNSLYHNVLHRDGDAGGFAFHVGTLDAGASRADVLTTFSESPENQAQVAGLIGNGIVYTPYG